MQEFPSIGLRRGLEDIGYVVPQNEYGIYYLMKLIPIVRFYKLDISYNGYKYNVYYGEQYVDNPTNLQLAKDTLFLQLSK